jgi:hypothetical protein
MIHDLKNAVPEDHPLRELFLTLAERGMSQLQHRDRQVVQYLGDLLAEMAYTDNLNRIASESGERLRYLSDMLAETSSQIPGETRWVYFKHVGDLALFNLGLFPEHLTYGRRLVSTRYYTDQGRRSYSLAAQSEHNRQSAVLLKLADEFETCVAALNWVKAYIRDPFFQYMFREFDIT